MSQSSKMKNNIFYRHFDLSTSFPAIGLLGDNWQVKPNPFARQHFHNCLEIGYLQEGDGVYYSGDRECAFKTPCLVLTV